MEKPKNEMSFSYGGQAVIEGILMRGSQISAIAARDPEGRIVVHEQPLNKTVYQGRIAKMPFVRGMTGIWDALGLGMRALMWSADIALGEEEDVNFNGPIGFVTVAFSMVLGIGLFFLLPTAASAGVEKLLKIEEYTVLTNIIEGFIRLFILILYISLISLMPDVRRLFSYHGAEHKTINAYEDGAELTPEIVASYPIEHPRCGTAFLLIVVFVSIFCFALLGRPSMIWLLISRIVLIPVIAGIAYEYLRFTAKHIEHPVVRKLSKPGLALQHLTTREPDADMLEVGITAFKRVLLAEELISEEEAAIPTELKPQETTFSAKPADKEAETDEEVQVAAQVEIEAEVQ
jgi:uncharacterized protein YqhQ